MFLLLLCSASPRKGTHDMWRLPSERMERQHGRTIHPRGPSSPRPRQGAQTGYTTELSSCSPSVTWNSLISPASLRLCLKDQKGWLLWKSFINSKGHHVVRQSSPWPLFARARMVWGRVQETLKLRVERCGAGEGVGSKTRREKVFSGGPSPPP